MGFLVSGCGVRPAPIAKVAQKVPASVQLRWSNPPAMTLNPRWRYQAVVQTTAGRFVIQLFAKQDPVAANNFVFLARHGYYDHNQFFRVLAPFIVQSGDPLNNGLGGPGYQWRGELPPPYPYQPGIVAMAIAGQNTNSNGSQFFICTGSESQTLNQNPLYTEVGRVVKGWTVVQKIANAPVTTNPKTHEPSLPVNPVSITHITILSKPR